MPILDNFNEFAGRHYETGTLRDALAWEGVRAPHTGEPPSEALLLGISGGIAFGYFTFHYQGYPPHLALLTRNTFDPLTTLLERLAIPRDVRQTASADRGAANLRAALEEGHAAIVMADSFSLPWTLLPPDERNWAMTPLLVHGLDDDHAWIAGPSSQSLVIPAATLAAARGRVKKEKFRVTTLGAPDFSRLESAVEAGLQQCLSLFTEGPPRGSRNNFGLVALERWAELLTNTRNKQSWARYFAPGRDLMMALAGNHTQPGAFGFIELWGFDGMERAACADFLDEAAIDPRQGCAARGRGDLSSQPRAVARAGAHAAAGRGAGAGGDAGVAAATLRVAGRAGDGRVAGDAPLPRAAVGVVLSRSARTSR